MQELGFVGAKIPCPYSPNEGDDGLARNLEAFKSARQSVGTDFPLMSGSICCLSVCLSVSPQVLPSHRLDCYMALTVPYAIKVSTRVHNCGRQSL